MRFHIGGQDVTRQITEGGGLPFVGRLRLWPGDARPVQVALTRRNPSAGAVPPPTVDISLRPHPSAQAQASQVVTLRPMPGHTPDRVALRR